jgi:hypothetical protein
MFSMQLVAKPEEGLGTWILDVFAGSARPTQLVLQLQLTFIIRAPPCQCAAAPISATTQMAQPLPIR